MFKKSFSAVLIVLAVALAAAAQEVDVDRYTVNARVDLAASAVEVRAQLAMSNLAQTPKPKLYLRLSKMAKVSSVTVNGAPAQFETPEDRRVPLLNQLIVTPATPITAGAKALVEVNYRIEAPETTTLVAVYSGEVLLAPESVWVPMPSTMYALYGAPTAPFTLTVTTPSGSSMRVASAGVLKADPGTQSFTFEQPLNSLPFFIASHFAQPIDFDYGGVKVAIQDHEAPNSQAGDVRGANSRDQVRGLLRAEIARIIDFLTKTLGPPPAGANLRIISSSRAGSLVVPGAVVLNSRVFRQSQLDVLTVEQLADAAVRIWTDGRARIRGQEPRSAQPGIPAQKPYSVALLRDSLPRYLAALYFEDRFGKEVANEAYSRMRWAYTPVAKSGRDAELELQTFAFPNYAPAVYGKGPLVLRLMAETMGRDKFLGAVRSLFSAGATRAISLDDLQAALTKAGAAGINTIFEHWVRSIIEPDIIIGIPQPAETAGAQRVNIRNLGTGNVTVPVVATTASGKQITVPATVPSEDITSVDIQTSEKITFIEADPDKLLIQSNYDNDAKPVRTSTQTLLNDSIIDFNKGQFAGAETKLRDALRANPQNPLLHAWLARTLAAQNKTDEAVREANAAIKIEPPVYGAAAWAHITLGQAALARGQAAEAVEHLRRAVIEADEVPAQYAAREALVKAERAAGIKPQVEDSVRAFITQLDLLIKQPSSDKLFAVVSKNNLKKFVQGLTVAPPTAWATEILHAEYLDANRIAVDVGLKVTAGGRDQSGTAVFVLSRVANGWMLEDVQLFNVK